MAWGPNWNPRVLRREPPPPLPKGSLTMSGFSLGAPAPGLQRAGRPPWAAGTRSSSRKPPSRPLANDPEAAHRPCTSDQGPVDKHFSPGPAQLSGRVTLERDRLRVSHLPTRDTGPGVWEGFCEGAHGLAAAAEGPGSPISPATPPPQHHSSREGWWAHGDLGQRGPQRQPSHPRVGVSPTEQQTFLFSSFQEEILRRVHGGPHTPGGCRGARTWCFCPTEMSSADGRQAHSRGEPGHCPHLTFDPPTEAGGGVWTKSPEQRELQGRAPRPSRQGAVVGGA